MPAAFENLAQWLGWPRRLAKDVVFCVTSLSILVTWATFHVHFFRLHADVLGFCYAFVLDPAVFPRPVPLCLVIRIVSFECRRVCFHFCVFFPCNPPLTILRRDCRHADTFTWREVVFHGPWTRVLARSTCPTPSKFVRPVWWRANQRVGRSRDFSTFLNLAQLLRLRAAFHTSPLF